MSIVNKPQIIIAAIASRPYVEAAVAAGFEVIAIDAFVDADTLRITKASYQVELCDGQLSRGQLLEVLDSLNLQHFVGFCYGAGFEKTPGLLNAVSKRIVVIGNSVQVIEKCKTPNCFFRICDELNITHPPVVYERPLHSNGWLLKEPGGSGGGHVKQLSIAGETHKHKVYYQAFQKGRPISCLFMANDGGVQVVGISEQWLDATNVEPFRYGGAASHADITEGAKKCLVAYVGKLAKAIGLVGLNSCDVICDGDNIYVLEINPRLSATVDLYTAEYPNLFAVHVEASRSKFETGLFKSSNLIKNSKAHHVIYAQYDVTIGDNMSWPSWVRDVPHAGSFFEAGMPICTAFAEAETALLAKQLVQDKVAVISHKLLN